MTNLTACFTPFSQSIDNTVLPEKFTFPFYYQPQPIAIAAALQLQQQLEQLPISYSEAFTETKAEQVSSGKMFGVLVVKSSQDNIGFLSAYSGQLDLDVSMIKFVPAVSNMQLQDSAFLTENRIINNINAEITVLENSQQLSRIRENLNDATIAYQQALSSQQNQIVLNRQQRKQRKKS